MELTENLRSVLETGNIFSFFLDLRKAFHTIDQKMMIREVRMLQYEEMD